MGRAAKVRDFQAIWRRRPDAVLVEKKRGRPESLYPSAFPGGIMWNTDASCIPAAMARDAASAAAGEVIDWGLGKLFTSYSHVESLAPAMRRETIFGPETRQENLPRGARFYFVETATFS